MENTPFLMGKSTINGHFQQLLMIISNRETQLRASLQRRLDPQLAAEGVREVPVTVCRRRVHAGLNKCLVIPGLINIW
jgi:hypothetical protein